MINVLIALLYIALFLSFYMGFILGQLAQIAKQKSSHTGLKVLVNNAYGKHPQFNLPPDEEEWRKTLIPPKKY